jgi:RNA polymerase sigma factor (sigma-70 family)
MALETLIDRNYQPIKKYFCRQLFWYPKYEQRQARAEELTQDTFNRASLKLYDYQFIEGKPFVHWLYAFANRIRLEDKRRAEKHIAESLEELLQTSQEPQDSPMNEPDTALHQKEFEQQYQQAVTDLPEMERNVWIRSTHQQLSHKAIAQQLNITEQYSRTILCRAKQHLGSILIDRGIVDPQHWQLRKGPGSDSSSSE